MRRKNKRRVIFSVVFICLAIMCCIGCSQKDDKQKEKTPQSLEITALLVRLPGLEPGASGLGVWLTIS